jgi:hypothetical protein
VLGEMRGRRIARGAVFVSAQPASRGGDGTVEPDLVCCFCSESTGVALLDGAQGPVAKDERPPNRAAGPASAGNLQAIPLRTWDGSSLRGANLASAPPDRPQQIGFREISLRCRESATPVAPGRQGSRLRGCRLMRFCSQSGIQRIRKRRMCQEIAITLTSLEGLVSKHECRSDRPYL